MTKDVAAPTAREVDPRLLRLLVCPLTKRPLQYDKARQELISKSARLAFPIRDGVPLLTLDAARDLSDEEAP
ncbi:MAG TPA: Trm112 family protein [Hyphomicrobiaceae bacterium]|nr:Trm112 family protein [Hyphomicrobiaceae bacterium]